MAGSSMSNWTGASRKYPHFLPAFATELSSDPLLFSQFTVLVQDHWQDGITLSGLHPFLIQAAALFISKPALVRKLNTILPAVEECIVVIEEDNQVDLVVIKSPSHGEIYPISSKARAEPSEITNTATLRSTLFWGDLKLAFMKLQPSWARGVMELLQIEISHGMVNRMYTKKCLRHLKSLSRRHKALPPSFLIHDVTREGHFAVKCGGFADIWMGSMNDQKVCLKVLRFFLTASDKVHRRLLESFCREALTWKRLHHPYILPFLGVSDKLFHPTFCLICPWMENGSLMDFLEKHPDHDRCVAIMEIAEAVRYLHEFDPPIVHADIRGANILVSDDYHCRLADFGLSVVTESQSLSGSSLGMNGTVAWMAPELLSTNPPKSVSVSRDIYAFGCTMLEILTGQPPFHYHKHEVVIMNQVLDGQRPERPETILPSGEPFPDALWEIIGKCWRQDPELRPSARNVLMLLEQEKRTFCQSEDDSYPFSLLFEGSQGFESYPDERTKEVEETASEDDDDDADTTEHIIDLYYPDLTIVTDNLSRNFSYLPEEEESTGPSPLSPFPYPPFPQVEYSPASTELLSDNGLSPQISPFSPPSHIPPFTPTDSPLISSKNLKGKSPIRYPWTHIADSSNDLSQDSDNLLKMDGIFAPLKPGGHLRSHSSALFPAVPTVQRKAGGLSRGRFKSMMELGSPEERNDLWVLEDYLPSVRITVARSFTPSREANSCVIQIDPGNGKPRWRVGKTYGDVVGLDENVRKVLGEGGKRRMVSLPRERLWSDNSPAKVDLRKLLLEKYLQNLVRLPVTDNREIIAFFTSNVVDENGVGSLPPGYKEGYLTKRGRRFGSWKTRYLYLSGNVLKYCESRGDPCIGSIKIIGSKIEQIQSRQAPAGDEDDYYRHGFTIVELTDGGIQLHHILCAESDEERDHWVEMLRFASKMI